MCVTDGHRAAVDCLYCAFITEPVTVDWKGADELWPSIADAYGRMQGLGDSGAVSTSLAARQVDRVQPAGHRPYIAALAMEVKVDTAWRPDPTPLPGIASRV